jgi:hypothetical protein
MGRGRRRKHTEWREARRPLRIYRHRWEDNINTNFRQIIWCDMDWIHLAQDRDQSAALVNTVMNLRVP